MKLPLVSAVYSLGVSAENSTLPFLYSYNYKRHFIQRFGHVERKGVVNYDSSALALRVGVCIEKTHIIVQTNPWCANGVTMESIPGISPEVSALTQVMARLLISDRIVIHQTLIHPIEDG